MKFTFEGLENEVYRLEDGEYVAGLRTFEERESKTGTRHPGAEFEIGNTIAKELPKANSSLCKSRINAYKQPGAEAPRDEQETLS